ncbi:unnamed protein product [Rotaria sp. Silwood1]|nr:unnamed protein product [Rotaria sp. Silwood1]
MNLEKYDVPVFVQAGELRYLDTTIGDIFEKISQDYMKSNNFTQLILQSIEPVMYLLKRQQSLSSYTEQIRMNCENCDTKDKLDFSQRLLFHILLSNSNPELSRILMISMSKQNAVPFLQPNVLHWKTSNECDDRYYFEPNIIYIWDYATPTLLSFGFGSCSGKSTLLNQLFRSTFEQKNEKSVYFQKTMDIDFGYNFITKRPLNIADMHGNVSNSLPRNVLSLFDGYIMHQVARATFYDKDVDEIFYMRSQAVKINDEYQFEIISSQQEINAEKQMKLSKKYSNECGRIFELFIELLSTSNRLMNLDLLSNELKQKRNMSEDNIDLADNLSIEKTLSVEVLWRNAIVCQKYDQSKNPKQLRESYSEYIKAGFPFEIIDGDNFFFQYDFLSKVMQKFSQQKILIISIIGPQNSGKSTLLNYMFGTLFDVRNGRCTRGVYGSFVKSNIPSFDYIMLIDTEGLLGTEKGDLEYDRRLILFCLAVSHLVIVNIAGDLNQALKDMIILCVDSLKEINVNKMPTPVVHFVLNQRPDTNLANNQKAIKNIVEQLQTDTTDKTIAISIEQFHSLPSAFKLENILDIAKLPKLQVTSNDFLEETTKLTKVLIKSAIDNYQRSPKHYIDPLKWIQNAYTVFDILQHFPDLTHFKDLKEKRLDKQIRDGIRELLKTKLSATEKKKSFDNCSNKARSQIDEIFQISFDGIYKECEKSLQKIFEELGPSSAVRERSIQFLKTQIFEARNAWRDAAYRIHDENELNLLVRNGEQDLRNLIDKTIKETAEKGDELKEEDARQIFNHMYKQKMKNIKKEFNAKERLRNAVIAVYSLYDMYEKDCLPTGETILRHTPLIDRISNDFPPYSSGNADADSTDDEFDIHGQHKKRRPMQLSDAINNITKTVSKFDHERSMIEVKAFITNLNVAFAEEIINKMKYLKKDNLRNIYFVAIGSNNDNNDGHHLRNHSVFSRIKRFFISPSSSIKVIDSNLTNYRYTIHDLISNQPSNVLDAPICFETLFKNVMDEIEIKVSSNQPEQHFHSIDLQLIQKVVASVNSLITQIDNELSWFNTVLSKQIKSRFHICIVILLTRIYYHEQKNHFEAQLAVLEKNKDTLLNDFIVKTVKMATRDTGFAKDLTDALLEISKEQFKTKAQLLIKNII